MRLTGGSVKDQQIVVVKKEQELILLKKWKVYIYDPKHDYYCM